MKINKPVPVIVLYACIIFIAPREAQAIDLGYTAGINRIGINPSGFQPVYGICAGHEFNKYLGFETILTYSQRTKESAAQADYLGFALLAQAGYFTKKAGVYYAPGFSLNPTLYHSNIENHTYVSFLQALGARLRIGKSVILDLKVGYDLGLSGAYFENGTYKKYNGPILLGSFKYRFCACPHN